MVCESILVHTSIKHGSNSNSSGNPLSRTTWTHQLILEGGQNAIGWYDGGTINYHILHAMLDNFPTLGIHFVYTYAIDIEGIPSISHYLGDKDCVPGYSDGLACEIVDHSGLDGGCGCVVEEFDYCLEEGEGVLVAAEACELYT